jgi:hypothetical protein
MKSKSPKCYRGNGFCSLTCRVALRILISYDRPNKDVGFRVVLG